MHTHFNQRTLSITDAENALLQRKIPGKMGNISLGELLLNEQDKDGNPLKAPAGRLQGYIAGRIFEKGDIIIPAISPDLAWPDALAEISRHSMAHDYMTLAFDGNSSRYRAAYLGPIQRNAKPIEIGKITQNDLPKLRFFGGGAYIIS